METKAKRIIAIFLIFLLLFSNFGFTLEAIASSEEFKVISGGIFKKNELYFKVYFEDDGLKYKEKVTNVNEKAILKVDITPKVDGYLDEAVISAVSEDDLNFKISSIRNLDELLESDIVSNIEVISGGEIKLEKVLNKITLEIELEYIMSENIKLEELYKEILFKLDGIFIDFELNEIKIEKENTVFVGWKYTNNFEITSDYTNFSPFNVYETELLLVENTITFNRNIQDEKYLPLKSIELEVDVPIINNIKPSNVNVIANKLMATRGEDTGNTKFTKDNWNYDEESGKIIINVSNDEIANSLGNDEFIVMYRYDTYLEEENITLDKKLKVRVEEYSGNKNNVLTEEIDEIQEINSIKNELITYTLGTSEEKISKGKINANYNLEDDFYLTDYVSNLRVNILTSDIIEEIKLDCSREYYIDKDGNLLQAEGIKYKSLKFNYYDLKNILAGDGKIEIYSLNGNLLVELNKDLITSENDYIVALEDEYGVYILIKDISADGKIDIEITKEIIKPNVEKEVFANVKELKSVVLGEVKHKQIEEKIMLPEISTVKSFKESYTNAEISLNKTNLTTTQDFEEVEIKIELNNDDENTDLYENPEFEIKFPKYIKEVEVKTINIIYDEGLTYRDFEIYKDNDNIKMKIMLDGVQKRFSLSNITHGTNIIINAKIVIDSYTPKIKDQIEMVYFNQGVTNYQSQTEWRISSPIPKNIIKNLNGVDAEVFDFQAPAGFILASEIENYDGQMSVIRSVKQGEKTAQIEMGKASKVAKMNLIAINNTDNKCMDIVMIGRVPNTDATDVITKEKLRTNRDTKMVTELYKDINNEIECDFYYSYDANAEKNLDELETVWTKEPDDFTKVKSFMIIPKEEMSPGAILKFNYEFEIPENLPYEAEIFNSFGAYYNNCSDYAIVYETSSADPVGLVTEAGAKVEATLSVDIGDDKDVLEQRMMEYTITVKNTGSVDLVNVNIKDELPDTVVLCEESLGSDGTDNNYCESNEKVINWNIDYLKPGEFISKKIVVRTLEKSFINSNYEFDENGYYSVDYYGNKIYIRTLDDDIYIENKAIISIENYGNLIETNVVRNKLVDANFNIMTALYAMKKPIVLGDEFEYIISVQNISDMTLDDVIIKDELPKEIRFISIVKDDDVFYEYNEEENLIIVKKDELESRDSIKIYVKCKVENMTNISYCNISNQVTVYANNIDIEKGTLIKNELFAPKLSAIQEVNEINNEVREYEYFNMIMNIKNDSFIESKQLNIKTIIPNELEIISISTEGNKQIYTEIINNVIVGKISSIDANSVNSIVIKLRPKILQEDESNKIVIIDSEVNEDNIERLDINKLEITIVKNPYNPITDEEKKEIEKENTIIDPIIDEKDLIPEYVDEDKNTQLGSKINNSNNVQNSQNNDKGNTVNGEKELELEEKEVTGDLTNSFNEKIEERKTVKITGEVWLDENENSIKDTNEIKISDVQVSLQKDNNIIRTIKTDSTGKYRFEDLEPGTYSVVFEYNGDMYYLSNYKEKDVPEDLNSDAVLVRDGYAISNNITVTEGEEIIDIGLLYKDRFDLQIEKYITKAIIKTKGKEKVHEYNNEKLAKVDIRAKDLENTDVTLYYNIVVKNIGNTSGKVGTIIDYLPKDLEFLEEKNEGWNSNSDGVLYNKSLSNIEINPKEEIEITLVVNKKMTASNTGVISNKVELKDLSNKLGLDEIDSNNITTQEMIISIRTGKTLIIISSLLIITVITGSIYIVMKLKKKKFFR